MRTPLLRCTLLSAAIGSLLASPVQASEWNGSYIANGQCFCAGALDSSVRNQLVPTPIGSQSIDQVCDRIGDGPKLVRTDGIFNFPVYADPQCGHGPFSEGSVVEASCSGSYEPGIDCQSAGPNWNMQALYEQEQVVQEASTTAVAVTGGSRYIDPALFKASDDEPSVTASVDTEVVSNVVSEVNEPVEAERVAARRVDEEQLLAEQQQALEAERRAAWDQEIAPSTSIQTTEAEQSATQSVEELRLAAEQARMAYEAGLAEQAQAEEAKLAKQAQADEAAKLAKQAQADEAAKLAKQAQADEAAKLAKQAQADEAAKLAKQAQADEAAKLAEQAQADEAAKLAEQAQADEAAKLAEKKAVERSASIVAETNNDSAATAPFAALQLPAGVQTNYNDFEYLQALPLGYDYGGGGMALSGSYSTLNKWHYVGRAGLADTYQEVFFGAGYYLTPPTATRMTVVATAGIEHGRFDLSSGDINASDNDTGLALSLASRFVVNQLVELQAGVGYSSFFDGDIHFLGGGFVHINNQLDLTSQFEIGDNDSFGLGIRYYY